MAFTFCRREREHSRLAESTADVIRVCLAGACIHRDPPCNPQFGPGPGTGFNLFTPSTPVAGGPLDKKAASRLPPLPLPPSLFSPSLSSFPPFSSAAHVCCQNVRISRSTPTLHENGTLRLTSECTNHCLRSSCQLERGSHRHHGPFRIVITVVDSLSEVRGLG